VTLSSQLHLQCSLYFNDTWSIIRSQCVDVGLVRTFRSIIRSQCVDIGVVRNVQI
jgi:hypothetical protein